MIPAWGNLKIAEKPLWQYDCGGSRAAAVCKNAVVVAKENEAYLAKFSHIADENRRTMLAMNYAMDANIGKVMDKLKELDLEENTLEGTWTAEFANGDVRTGSGKPVGDIAENRQAGTIAFKIQGSGKFELL